MDAQTSDATGFGEDDLEDEGMDVDQTSSQPPPKKPRNPPPQRKSSSQKALELKERDVRVLVRSLQNWGDIRQRYDTIVLLSFFVSADCCWIEIRSSRLPRLSSPRRTVA